MLLREIYSSEEFIYNVFARWDNFVPEITDSVVSSNPRQD